jgi:hypothetical protein
MNQVDPKSLEAIFNKDPNEITDEERDRIIAYYRDERLNWKHDEANGKKKEPKKKAPAGMTIEDLGL